MPIVEQNEDSTKQSYLDNLVKVMNQPHASTTLGYFFVGMSILLWSSSVTELLGFNQQMGIGGMIFSAVGLSLTILTILANQLMVKVGIERPVRSSLWMSAIAGSYVSLTTYPWGIPIFSEIGGFATSIIVFIATYILDKKFGS